MKCECGGHATLIDGSDPQTDSHTWEKYECTSCGRTGGLRIEDALNQTRERYTGYLVNPSGGGQ